MPGLAEARDLTRLWIARWRLEEFDRAYSVGESVSFPVEPADPVWYEAMLEDAAPDWEAVSVDEITPAGSVVQGTVREILAVAPELIYKPRATKRSPAGVEVNELQGTDAFTSLHVSTRITGFVLTVS